MASSAHFYSSHHDSVEELGMRQDAVLFHGIPVDQREELAIKIEGAPAHDKVLVSYDIQNMALSVDGVTSSADVCAGLLQNYIDGRQIVLEATTLGFAELFCVIRGLIALGVRIFQIIYVEPRDYTQPVGGESFALSELISGYHPIPHAVVDLSSDEVEAGVFFLGYEPERMARALSEYQMIVEKTVKVVFGVPAFQAGWELNAIVPHLPMLSEQSGFDVAYCSANDPGSAFDCLQRTRNSLSRGSKMFIAPIGTKPCGIATAVFASLFPNEAGILFDHPRKKSKRSSGVNVWHRYIVRINI
ncbi:hypothetical protein HF313_00515 [Massilia atriviolacea]|uniref:Uncharacterized protein n=1 Tax=Massilia atriviolacea TaxID=2495579 RepID=A0A430HL10_9BURK|nr:hypothetical protein [Massilia atriviolacea]RSZ58218.1 hypothetical protein EJB06_14745 [Massilia atriviolacea]